MAESIGNWLVIALPLEVSSGERVPFFWTLHGAGFTSGDASQETADPPAGVPSIVNQVFDGLITGGVRLKRTILGGNALFSQRSRLDSGSLVVQRRIGDTLVLDDIASAYIWRGSPAYYYYADGSPTLFSDYELRRSVVFTAEPSLEEAKGTATFSVGAADYKLDEPLQASRYSGLGACYQGGSQYLEVTDSAPHPNLVTPDGEFTLRFRTRHATSPGSVDQGILRCGTETGATEEEAYLGVYLQTSNPPPYYLVVKYTADDDTVHTYSLEIPYDALHDDAWHLWHVVRVYEDSAWKIRVYLDGTLEDEETSVAAPYEVGIGYGVSDVQIGKHDSSSSACFAGGLLDEIELYRGVAHAPTDLPEGPADGTEDDLSAAFSFEDFGSTYFDSVSTKRSNIRDGLLVRATTDYVLVPADTVFDLSACTGARVRVTGSVARLPSDRAEVTYFAYKSGCFRIFVDQTNKINGTFYDSGVGWGTSVVSTTTVDAAVPYTVDLTYNETTGVLRLYVDGELEDEETGLSELLATAPASNVFLGGTDTTHGDLAWIFDFAVFDAATRPRLVASQATGPLVGVEPALVAYFRLDEGSGTSITCSVDETLVGTVSGADWVSSSATVATADISGGYVSRWRSDSLEGGRLLAGAYKPEGHGRVIGKRPVCLSASWGIYQVHAGPIERFRRLSDGGDELEYTGEDGDLLGATATVDDSHAIPGTVSMTASSTTVTGSGTFFSSWLLPGEPISINGEDHTVLSVTSETELELGKAATGTASGKTLYRSRPRPGFYRTDLDRGLLQVGQPPTRGYECDFDGHRDAVLDFTDNPVEIAERVIRRFRPRWYWVETSEYGIRYPDSLKKTDESFAWGQWLRIPSWESWGSTISIFGNLSSAHIYVDSSGKANAYVTDGSNSATATSSVSVNDDAPHLVIGEVDRTADKLRLYVDGELEDEVSIATVSDLATGSGIWSGYGSTGSPALYLGQSFFLDDISDTASAYEILSQRDFNESEVEAFWPYNEGRGGRFLDLSGSYEAYVYYSAVGSPSAAWAGEGGSSIPIDSASFAALAAEVHYPCQLWTGTDGVPLQEWLDRLAASWRGFWGINQDGEIFVGEFDPDAASSRTVALEDIDATSVSARQALIPTGKVSVGYALREAVFSPDKVFPVSDPDEYAEIVGRLDSDFEILELDSGSTYPETVDRTVETACSTRAGALAVGTWHAGLFAALSWLVSLAIDWLGDQDDELGDVVTCDRIPIITDSTDTASVVEIDDEPRKGISRLVLWARSIVR